MQISYLPLDARFMNPASGIRNHVQDMVLINLSPVPSTATKYIIHFIQQTLALIWSYVTYMLVKPTPEVNDLVAIGCTGGEALFRPEQLRHFAQVAVKMSSHATYAGKTNHDQVKQTVENSIK